MIQDHVVSHRSSHRPDKEIVIVVGGVGLDDSGARTYDLDVQSDVTGVEALWLNWLMSAIGSRVVIDVLGFLEDHNLFRHFRVRPRSGEEWVRDRGVDVRVQRAPWREDRGGSIYYAKNGPDRTTRFTVEDGWDQVVEFMVSPTGEEAIHSGRARYMVRCECCDRVVHEATTGILSNVRGHMVDAHGWSLFRHRLEAAR